MRTKISLRAAYSGIALLCMPPASGAFTGTPRVAGHSPRGAQAGSVVEVEFTGSGLKETRGFLPLTTDKLKLKRIGPETVPEPAAETPPEDRNERREWERRQQRAKQARDERAKEFATGARQVLLLEVAADCPPGRHAFRVQTNEGLADVVTFWVSRYPHASEKEVADTARTETNGTRETAEPLMLNQTLQGVLNGGDADVYRIDMKKGARLAAELEAERLCSSDREDGFEAELVVHDATGNVLARADDTALLLTDPWLEVTAPADGPLYITVKPLLPAADSRRVPYRLHAGSFVRPAWVYPAGGPPGALEITLADGSKQKVTLPAANTPDPALEADLFTAGAATLQWRASPETPAPNMLRVFPGPNVMEAEPNDAPDAATSAAVDGPVALNGVLSKAGDRDHFRFRAKKGDKLLVRLFGQAIGSPMDAKLTVSPAPGLKDKTERADDSSDTDLGVFDGGTMREKLDPVVSMTASADGEYVVTVDDSRGSGGPDFIYRVEIAPAQSGMLLSLAPLDRNTRLIRSAVTAGRGNRTVATILTRPLPGPRAEGELRLTAHGLPQGVKMLCDPFKADQGRIPVIFEAAADAPVACANVRLEVTTADGKPVHTLFRHTLPLVTQNNDPFHILTLQTLAVAVAEEVPFQLEVAPPPGALAKNGETELEVTVKRAEGWKEEIELIIDLPPAGIVGAQGLTVPPGKEKVSFRLAADGNARPGTFPIVVTGRNKSGDGRTGAGKVFAASSFIPVEIADPWVRLKFSRCAIERGQKATLTATVERLRDAPGKATLNLLRLPKGLTLTSQPTLTGDKVVFELEAAPDALVGSYSGISAEVSVEKDGRSLKQLAGYAALRIDPARVAVTR